MSTTNDLPLIRLSLIMPLVEGFESLGLDISPLLEPFQLSREKVAAGDLFVPSKTMYELVEAISEASGDPYFGVNQGDRFDPWSWPPLANAAAVSKTVGDCLLRFSLIANLEASSIIYGIDTSGSRCSFTGQRVTSAGVDTRHNDGFSIAYVLKIVHSAVGKAWEGSRVLARVSDPSVIPPGYLGIRRASSEPLSFSVDFPTEWLLLPLQLGSPPESDSVLARPPLPEGSVVEAFQHAMRPHLHESDLNSGRIASLFGLSKRTLARRLAAADTTISGEISALRRHLAKRLLGQEMLPIAEVGAKVGYPDPAVFTRTFRRWEGCTPSEFRKRSRLA